VAGVLALAAVSAVACGGVQIPAEKVTAEERTACRGLMAALPASVSDRPRRETDGSPLGAAWGDPAIVLRCGVGTPRGFDRFSRCEVANGLGWFVPDEQVADQEVDVVMTTVERAPRVEVVVPAEYRPPEAVMVDLAEAIKQHTRLVKPCS
jgi:hypothetical protein